MAGLVQQIAEGPLWVADQKQRGNEYGDSKSVYAIDGEENRHPVERDVECRADEAELASHPLIELIFGEFFTHLNSIRRHADRVRHLRIHRNTQE